MKISIASIALLILLSGCVLPEDSAFSRAGLSKFSSFDWLWADNAAADNAAAGDGPAQQDAAADASAADSGAGDYPSVGDVPETSGAVTGDVNRRALETQLRADAETARRADADIRRGEQAAAPLRPEHVANIYFDDGRADLAAGDAQVITQVVNRLRAARAALPSANGARTALLHIVGHDAPATGDGQIGGLLSAFRLSLDRARAVAAEFTRQGLTDDDMRVEARGASYPYVAGVGSAVLNDPAYLRRVEVYLIYR